MEQEKLEIEENSEKKEEKQKEERIKLKREVNVRIIDFLDFLRYEKGSSENTLIGYERDLKHFFLSVSKNVEEIQEDDIYKYIEKIGEKLKRNSILRKISAIRTFYKFCYLNKIVKEDPTNMIRSLKREKRLPETLTLQEIKRIVDNCNHTPEGMQNKMIIKFLIATGARIS